MPSTSARWPQPTGSDHEEEGNGENRANALSCRIVATVMMGSPGWMVGAKHSTLPRR